jgi:hypothetical protein
MLKQKPPRFSDKICTLEFSDKISTLGNSNRLSILKYKLSSEVL